MKPQNIPIAVLSVLAYVYLILLCTIGYQQTGRPWIIIPVPIGGILLIGLFGLLRSKNDSHV